MHVILICTSVIIQLYSVLGVRGTADFTDICFKTKAYDFYLTSGVGSFDSQSLIISTEKPIDCSITFYIMDGNYVLALIEIPDWHFKNELCFQESATTFTVSPYKKNQTCTAVSPGPRQMTLGKEKLVIVLNNITTIHTLRIICTAMRDPGLYKCKRREVKCVYVHKVYCMSEEFMCDGYANCGVPNEYDEDFAVCRGFGVTYFMIFCSIVMCVMSLLLLALLFLSLSPKKRETFVYKFDNSLPLFDSDSGVVNYDIDIKVLFPTALKSMDSTKSILMKR